jgi:rhamnosyltransferase
MSISVIIPTYNAQKYLPKLLDKLSKQTINFELIIIDSSSSDNTLEIAKEYASKIITIPKSEFDHGATRSKALDEASGDIVVFLTQDALPTSNDAIEKLTDILIKNKDVAAVYGRQIPYEDATLFGKHLREFNYKDSSYIKSLSDKESFGIKTAFCSDSFAAYKKDAIKSVEFFKAGTIVGEDMHIVARLLLKGYKKAYCADASVYHSHNYTILEDFKRYFDTGVFHVCEPWLIEKFGKAEGEGKKFIKSELNYLIKNRAYHKLPEFVIRNGMKLIGYKLGKNYKKLPKSLAKSLSMHKSWWDRWA